jgi:hypothetical protein
MVEGLTEEGDVLVALDRADGGALQDRYGAELRALGGSAGKLLGVEGHQTVSREDVVKAGRDAVALRA